MATSTSCIYKSVTLQEGEVFVLPPGAEVISVSDDNNITSQAGCLNLDNLETLGCYIARVGATDDEGEIRFFKEGVDTKIEGFYLGDEYTSFASPYSPNEFNSYYDAPGLLFELKTLLPAVFDYSYAYYPAGLPPTIEYANATLTYFQIKTIPSIAENLYLYVTSNAGGPGNRTMIVKVPFIERSLITDENMPASICG